MSNNSHKQFTSFQESERTLLTLTETCGDKIGLLLNRYELKKKWASEGAGEKKATRSYEHILEAILALKNKTEH
jgi:hypothetical protein